MGGTLPQLFPLIMLLSVIAGGLLSRRYKADLPIGTFEKLWIGMAAFSGAILAAKLPYLIPGLPGFKDAESFLVGGKTILFGLVGGYFGVEFAKHHIGLTTKTGDTFVVPVAVSIAIGRLACFFVGCCYGTQTTLPWGVVFPRIDNLSRHPTQLYEATFHLLAACIAAILVHERIFRGNVIKLYFISYFVYRFLTEFIRPEPRIIGGLTAYQWTTLVLLPVFSWLWWRDHRMMIRRNADLPGGSEPLNDGSAAANPTAANQTVLPP